MLVVDDEVTIRQLISRTLVRQGYRVSVAVSAAEAIELLEREAVDVVVSDLNMPDMHGEDLARRARELRPSVALLFITGDHHARLPPELGSASLLHKPFGMMELLERLDRIVS